VRIQNAFSLLEGETPTSLGDLLSTGLRNQWCSHFFVSTLRRVRIYRAAQPARQGSQVPSERCASSRAYAGPDQAKDRSCRHGLQHLQMFGGRQIHLMSMTSSSVRYEIGCVPFIAAPRANAGITRFTADGQHGREVCRSFSEHSISIACERPAVAQDAQVMKALSRALERSHKGQIFYWRLRFALRVRAKFSKRVVLAVLWGSVRVMYPHSGMWIHKL